MSRNKLCFVSFFVDLKDGSTIDVTLLAKSNIFSQLVKCFGTEGRPTDRPTPPKDDIYEYITFRGSDIKDITLCEPPRAHHGLPPDPAIIQVGLYKNGSHSTIENLKVVKVYEDPDNAC